MLSISNIVRVKQTQRFKMKKLTILSITFLLSIGLTACGGGGSETASVAPTNPSNPTPSNTGKLIIDNGRGTVNNQDTERAE